MTACPFCARIAAGEYDSHTQGIVSFEPLKPVAAGHRLVVPIQHVTDAGEAPWLTGQVFAEAARLARVLDGAWNLITSAGPAATQTVPHLHVHLVPRHDGDGLALPWTGQREGRVTVSREDLRVFFAKLGRGPSLYPSSEAGQAERRLRDAAGGPT